MICHIWYKCQPYQHLLPTLDPGPAPATAPGWSGSSCPVTVTVTDLSTDIKWVVHCSHHKCTGTVWLHIHRLHCSTPLPPPLQTLWYSLHGKASLMWYFFHVTFCGRSLICHSLPLSFWLFSSCKIIFPAFKSSAHVTERFLPVYVYVCESQRVKIMDHVMDRVPTQTEDGRCLWGKINLRERNEWWRLQRNINDEKGWYTAIFGLRDYPADTAWQLL